MYINCTPINDKRRPILIFLSLITNPIHRPFLQCNKLEKMHRINLRFHITNMK